MKHTGDLYRRFRNTLRYLLGSLTDFRHEHCICQKEMPELERWMLHRLAVVEDSVQRAFRENRFQSAVQELHTFCTNDLSSFYFDVRKDVLYCDPLGSLERRSTQTVLASILQTLLQLLAPVLVFTAEEAWQTMRSELNKCFLDLPESVHFSTFPSSHLHWIDAPLAAHYVSLRGIRQVITGALEDARNKKTIGSALDAHPHIYLSPTCKASKKELLEIALTSDLSVLLEPAPEGAFVLPDQPGVGVVIQQAKGQKCERCWTIRPEVTPSLPLCERCQEILKP